MDPHQPGLNQTKPASAGFLFSFHKCFITFKDHNIWIYQNIYLNIYTLMDLERENEP